MIKGFLSILAVALTLAASVAVAAGPAAAQIADAVTVTGMDDADCPGCPAQSGDDAVACKGGCPVPCAFSIGAAVMPVAATLIRSLQTALAPRLAATGFRAGVGPPPDLSPPRRIV